MQENEKHFNAMMFKLKQKYGHHKIDDTVSGFIHAYKETLPWMSHKLFEIHYNNCIEYVAKRLTEVYPEEDYKWKQS